MLALVVGVSIASLSVRAILPRNWIVSFPNPPTICFGSLPTVPTNDGPLLRLTVTSLPETLNSLTLTGGPLPGVATTVALGLPSLVSILTIAKLISDAPPRVV